MTKQSAGLLVYRRNKRGIEVFLVHPGGPFFAKKDAGAWSIPKGELSGSDMLQEALRDCGGDRANGNRRLQGTGISETERGQGGFCMGG